MGGLTNGDRDSQSNDQLATLRQLLFGREKEQIDHLQQRLDDPALSARDVSRVLAEAIRIRDAAGDELGDTLGPTISNAFDASIKKDPRKLADAISPIMGPAIRKLILQTIRGMMQSLNRTIEHSFSWRGLTWRLEALRTGKPFSEVVLLNTFLYRVEQVFLIHRDSGLLLQHVSSDDAAVKDTDMISGMLTAIQDFVKDSFGGTDDGSLEAMHVGEKNVWVEHGSECVLAVVIQGEPIEDLRLTVTETLEQIQLDYAEAITRFDGETTALEPCRDQLEQCLQQRHREGTQAKSPMKAIIALTTVAVIIAGVVGYLAHTSWQQRTRWRSFVQELQDEPGIVIADVERNDDKYCITGLRDSLARDPQTMLDEHDLDPGSVAFRWKAYQSSEARIEQLRSERDRPWRDYLALLAKEPGIVVTAVDKTDDGYRIFGMRDPLAREPKTLLKDSDLPADKVRFEWRPYQSLEPEFRLLRVKRQLNPPPSVAIQLADDQLHISGQARHRWIAESLPQAHLFAGIVTMDTSQLVDLDEQEFVQHTAALQQLTLYFQGGNIELTEDSSTQLAEVAEHIAQLLATAAASERQVIVRVTGHAADSGEADLIEQVSQSRAEYVKDRIVKLGIPPERLEIDAVGHSQRAQIGNADVDLAANRRVTLQVIEKAVPRR